MEIEMRYCVLMRGDDIEVNEVEIEMGIGQGI